MPQPNLVPVSPRVSRSTHRSGVSGVTLTVSRLPLTVKVIAAMTGHPSRKMEKTCRGGRADGRGAATVPTRSGTGPAFIYIGARDSPPGAGLPGLNRLSGH